MADEIGLPPSNVAGYIRGLQAEGVGPTEGLRIFRDEPFGHIQDSRWFDLYKSVAQTIESEPAVLGLDPFSTPAPGEYGRFQLGTGGQYVSTVELQMIDRDTGEWFVQKVEYWSQEPHTPAEAEDALLADWADPDAQDTYGVTVMGAVTVNVWQTMPVGI